MSFKTFIQATVLLSLLVASFAAPGSARAWSGCSGAYVVQWGDTLGDIAARCGTTVGAILAINPGITGYLYAGQVLYLPGGDYCSNCPRDGYTGTYTVKRGDTFSQIAKRFGVSVKSLWAANPYIPNINRIYPGQVIYVPAYAPSYPPPYTPAPPHDWFEVISDDPVPLSYGEVRPGTPTGSVKLINIASADVYVSLQGTTTDGAKVINEYPVEGSMKVNVPSGWYLYVAWVGGEKYSGQFKLGNSSDRTIVFYPHRVVVE